MVVFHCLRKYIPISIFQPYANQDIGPLSALRQGLVVGSGGMGVAREDLGLSDRLSAFPQRGYRAVRWWDEAL